MLHFPPWKLALIIGVLLWGALLAMPNLFSDETLGIAPKQPTSTDAAIVAEYEAKLAASEASTWPGFLPDNKLKLGLDLQGGVYLLMEINPDDVVVNRLRVMAGDVKNTLNDRPVVTRVPFAVGTNNIIIELKQPDQMDDAMRRLERLNVPVGGSLGGAKTFNINELSGDRIEITITPASRDVLEKDALRKTMEIVRRRIDPDGVSEISIQAQGNTRIVLEAPGEANPQRIKDVLSQAGQMSFNLVDSSTTALQIALSTNPPQARPGWKILYDMETGEPLLIDEAPVVTGADIATANQGFDSRDNSPSVDFRLTGRGAKRFGDITARHVNERFAIVLDERVMSAPNINSPIYGGNVQITGRFTLEEARDLAAIIEAGELPAKLDFIEERTVGPGLGADSIRAGSRASIIGLALVAIFMLIAYGRLGIFTVLSLGANIILLVGALSGLGATLTLPGIAGIILTIGMAVDANVLVFERIREESHAGRSPMTAVQAGYERALSTILDANITTFIAALILYLLGAGPVKGFAVTLAIGIITSVFTAFVVTRLFTVMWLRVTRPKTLNV